MTMTTEREAERAAIVAWLKNDVDELARAGGPTNLLLAEGIYECAKAIEQGQHLQEQRHDK